MTVRGLKEYLGKFEEDESVHFIAADPKNRLIWGNDQIETFAITDLSFPTIGLKLHESEAMDKEMIKAAEEDEKEKVTVVENRELREMIHEATESCFLTKNEYAEIRKIILNACKRVTRSNPEAVTQLISR